MLEAKATLERAIKMYRDLTNEEDCHIAQQTFLPVDYQNLLFVGSELDELDCTFDFDDKRNAKTTTRAILKDLKNSSNRRASSICGGEPILERRL